MLNLSSRTVKLLLLFFGVPLYALIQYSAVALVELMTGEITFVWRQFSQIISALFVLLLIRRSLFSCLSGRNTGIPRKLLLPLSVAALFVLTYNLASSLLGRESAVPLETVSDGSLLSLLFYFVLTVGIAPIIEEYFFRGFVWKVLGELGGGVVLQVLITALFWGFLHGQYDMFDKVSLTLLGVVLGVVRARAEGIGRCVILHLFVNSIAFLETLFS